MSTTTSICLSSGIIMRKTTAIEQPDRRAGDARVRMRRSTSTSLPNWA